MNIVQVVPSIGTEASGPSYSVPGLCRGLFENGCKVTLYFTGRKPNRAFSFEDRCFPIVSFPSVRLARSPKMRKALTIAAPTTDVIHNNSFWMYPNVYPYFAIKKSGAGRCRLVNAPRGTLAEWSLKHHWLQKKLFGWFGGQYAEMTATDMWHATCEKEYEEIRELGYRQPVAIVPIGIDLPKIDISKVELQRRREAEGPKKRVVFFGRLHKVKAVNNLVLAWGNLADRFPKWELVIAGPDCGVLGELKSLLSEKRIPRVSFVGEINGSVKYEFLAAADIYVLPSHTENFAITIAEALACGTPVIASQGTPWAGLEHEKAGRWVQIGVAPLAEALREMMSMNDEERQQMGERGRQWMARDFSWKGIGAKMKTSYEWLLGKCDKPEWVKVD